MVTLVITYPRAEALAKTMNLERFMVPCPTTRGLYGYSSFVLDHKKAQAFLSRELRRPYSHESVLDALAILEVRAEVFRNR